MADRVNPSGIRDADPLLTAASMKHGGGDWIVTAGTDLYASYDGLAGALQAFDVASSSKNSFDVTIDTGEGFVGGAWLGRDSQTTVTLASQVSNQTVYVGWRHGATNTVIIGLDADFQADDPRIPIFDFDTDGSGVTSTTDRRPVGEQIDTRNEGSTAQADQAANANQLDNKDGSQYMRSDVEDTHQRPVEFGAGGPLSGSLGGGSGELFRAGGGASDTLLQTQGGFGRVAWSWNARYDSSNGEWQYIVDSEPAMVVLLAGGQIQFYTAGGGTADSTISFDTCSVENGSINRADDADEVGGDVAEAYLRAPLFGGDNDIRNVGTIVATAVEVGGSPVITADGTETFSGTVGFGGNNAIGLADPAGQQHAVTRSWAESRYINESDESGLNVNSATNLTGGNSNWKVQNGEVVNGGHSSFGGAQSAINFAIDNGYGTVVFPTGSFGGVDVTAPLTIVGRGSPGPTSTNETKFSSPNRGETFGLQSHDIHIRNIRIGNSDNPAIEDNQRGTIIEGCYISEANGDAILLQGERGRIIGNTFKPANYSGNGVQSGNNSIENSVVGNTNTGGVDLSRGTGNSEAGNT